MINPNWIFGFFQKKNPNWIFGFFQTKNFEEISKKSDELLVFSFLISKEIFPYSIQVKLTFRDAFCFIAHCSFSSHLQHLHSKAVRSCEVRTGSRSVLFCRSIFGYRPRRGQSPVEYRGNLYVCLPTL